MPMTGTTAKSPVGFGSDFQEKGFPEQKLLTRTAAAENLRSEFNLKDVQSRHEEAESYLRPWK
jgi:hypothetical protein